MPSRSLARPGRWALLVGALVAATGLAAAPGWAAGQAPQPSAGLVVDVPGALTAPWTAPGPLTCAGGARSSGDGAYTSVLTLTFDSPVGGWSLPATGGPLVPCPASPATS